MFICQSAEQRQKSIFYRLDIKRWTEIKKYGKISIRNDVMKLEFRGYIMKIRKYREKDIPAMISIWNKVVEDGEAFPQEDFLNDTTGADFFAAQTYCGVADNNGKIVGLYILHPNNIGRCGHIANASYAVDTDYRGEHIGEKLVADCLVQAKQYGFGILQFNAVVENNIHARHLYERLGFVQIGIVPKGFRMKDGTYQNICLYYHEL